MNKGFNSYIFLNRKLINSPIWKDSKPFSEGQAWVDILLHAQSFETVTEGGKKFERGKCYQSQLYFSKRWGWSRKKVLSFLKHLQELKMIEFKTEIARGTMKGTMNGTIITVINWDFFQKTVQRKAQRSLHNKRISEDIGEENQKISSPTEKENSDWFDSL